MMLSERKCSACRRDTPALSQQMVQKYLQQTPGWRLVDGRILTVFDCTSWNGAFLFLNMIRDLANDEDHHPNTAVIDCTKVVVSLRTKVVQGLTLNDFIMAAKIAALYEQWLEGKGG